MKLEIRDYVMIFLGLFAMIVAVSRFFIYRGSANHVMSGFILLLGIGIFLTVYRDVKKRK